MSAELREEPFRGEPPALVEPEGIRGDLQCHTTWSDGKASVEEMVRADREHGYDYLAISDHTPAVGAVRGLTPDDLRRQAEEIAAANELLVRCLSHPTGRYINRRAENALDLERVFEILSRDRAPRLGDCRKRPQHPTAAHDPRSASAGRGVILNHGSARVTSCRRG